jgi:hypothetical protein
MDRSYYVERLVDNTDGDELYSYAIICVEQGMARTVCMSIQTEKEAKMIAAALPWYETFIDGSVRLPNKSQVNKFKPKKRRKVD